MKILVTGANGYIGSKVVDLLCQQGFEVIATDVDGNHINKKAIYVMAYLLHIHIIILK